MDTQSDQNSNTPTKLPAEDYKKEKKKLMPEEVTTYTNSIHTDGDLRPRDSSRL